MNIIIGLYIVGVISFALIANYHARSFYIVLAVAFTWPLAVIMFLLEPKERRR